ncbi:LysE family translocator [Marinomonas sp. 2405UD68-3]|uniref:LysE family translocator n=1 Tax=Marinomonas sp. 2405UD68-3 TaxID=3391835 RepID=UPI0039C93D39
MIDLQGFILAILPIALSPGASFTLAISSVSSSGFRGVLKVIVGTGLGIVVHGILVGLGVSSVIAENAMLLNALTLCGIAFLFYLGVKLLVSGFNARSGASFAVKKIGVKDAFLLNIFNVKALLFYLTVVPMFAGADFIHYLYLSSLHVFIMLAWTSVCSLLFIMAQKQLSFAKVSLVVNVAGGVCLVYLACVSAFAFNR